MGKPAAGSGGGLQKAPVARIRDCGPYSSRNTSKGALLVETGLLAGFLAEGRTTLEAREAAFSGKLFTQRARTTRERIWQLLHHRLLAHGDPWVTTCLVDAFKNGPQSQEFVGFVYLHYLLRDRLAFDLVTTMLYDQWRAGKTAVSQFDVLSFLDAATPSQPHIARWAQTSRVRLARSILAALRDFDVLEGKVRKHIVKPALAPGTASHLIRLLFGEGRAGKELAEDLTWRAFMLSPVEAAEVIAKADHAAQAEMESPVSSSRARGVGGRGAKR